MRKPRSVGSRSRGHFKQRKVHDQLIKVQVQELREETSEQAGRSSRKAHVPRFVFRAEDMEIQSLRTELESAEFEEVGSVAPGILFIIIGRNMRIFPSQKKGWVDQSSVSFCVSISILVRSSCELLSGSRWSCVRWPRHTRDSALSTRALEH